MKEKTHNIYLELDSRKPGKYSYEGLRMSFLYEPFYVGKTFRIAKREKEHIKEAYSEKKSYNKIKSGKIRHIKEQTGNPPYFLVTEESIFHDNICELEKLYIKLIGRIDLKTGPLTNLTDGGEKTLFSKESREKISKSRMGKFKGSENPNFGNRGNKNQISKEYLLLSPIGEIIHVLGLNDWLKVNGFNPNRIQRLMVNNEEQRKSYKGWKICKVGDVCDLKDKDELSKTRKDKQSVSHKKYDYKLISPEGEVFYHHSLNDFCINHDLTLANMNGVVLGKVYHHKGWTGYIIGKENLRYEIEKEYNRPNWRVTFLNGDVLEINKLIDFSRKFSLNFSSCQHSANVGKPYKGYLFQRILNE